ncbi:MAG TPA: META domain-containing protein [Iamia sp.]
MPETPTIPDDDALVLQLRAWADDLAEQTPAAAVPTGEHPRRSRVLALAAVLMVALGLAAGALWAAADGDPAENVRAGTTTSTTTTESAPPGLPLLETTWWLERVEVDGEEPVIAPDRSLTMYLTEGEFCSGADADGNLEGCPHPDAFMVGSDACNGYWATVEISGDRITARPFGGRTLMACGSEPARVGAEVRPIEDGTSTFAIDGDTLVLRFGDWTTYRFRAEADPTAPVPEGHSVYVGREGEPRHRWSWSRGITQGEDVVSIHARAFEETRDNGVEASIAPDAPPGAIAAAVNIDPVLVVGLVDARATTVTYTRGDIVVEMPTRALEGVGGLRAFTGGVLDAAGGWQLVATAADGSTVATFDAGR